MQQGKVGAVSSDTAPVLFESAAEKDNGISIF